MGKTITTIFIGLFLLTTIHGFSQMTAIQYNNAVVDEQMNINKLMIAMADQFDKDLNQSEKIRVQLVSQCETSIKKLKSLPAYEGNSTFKKAGIALFTLYKNISKKEYKEIVTVLKKDTDVTTADIERLGEIEKSITKREAVLDDNFQREQKAFAAKHNIKLE